MPKSSFSPGIPSFLLEIPVAMTTAFADTSVPSSRTKRNDSPSLDEEMTFCPVNTAPVDSAWRMPSAMRLSPDTCPVPK